MKYLNLKLDYKRVIKQYLSMLYHGYLWLWLSMLLCMVAVAILEPSIVYLVKPIFDSGGDSEFIIDSQYLPYLVGVLTIVLAIFSYGSSYLGGCVSSAMQQDLRQRMVKHLLHLPMETFNEEPLGKMTTRFMSYVEGFIGPTRNIFVSLLQEPLKMIFYVGQMFYLQWQLALLICLVAPFVVLLTAYLKQRSKKIASYIQRDTAYAQSRLNESINFIQVLKVHGTDNVGERMTNAFYHLYKSSLRHVKLLSLGPPILKIIFAVPLVVLITYIINALVSGRMTVGAGAAFLACMLLMQRSLQSVTRLTVVLETMIVAGQEVLDFLDKPKEKDTGLKVMERARGDIVFENLCLYYPQTKKPALDNVSFRIAAGETVALVGRSGAGKTSIVNLLTRFYTPQQGQINLDGTDTRELTLASLRNQMALVTQQPLLLDDTVACNVCWPDTLDDSNRDRITQALKDASAHDFVQALPLQANTMIGENGNKLSGGERQRLALARVFYRDVPVVILDEPTSSLDNITEMNIRNVMQRLMSCRSVLIIAHRLSSMGYVDRVLVLDQGQLISQGSPSDLLKSCPLYQKLYHAQHSESNHINID